VTCATALPLIAVSSSKHRKQPLRPTANFYVDGFNLFYGCLKGTGYKWLDLDALFRTLVPTHEIKRIRYFTARISGRSDKPDSPTHQDAYLRALATLPNVTIHFGKFLQSTQRMALAAPRPGGPRTVEVIKTEEKGSDVNLATYLLIDAFRQDSDLAVVVSNDSDLCEPIRIVKDEYRVPVGLLNPHARTSSDLRKLSPTFLKQIRSGPLSASQFPQVVNARGRKISKPATW
jgi:NYN domain